jgi:TonB family protein
MSSRTGARQLGLALLCATFGVGCAGLIEMGRGAPTVPDLSPPRLVDESLTCDVLERPKVIHHEEPDYPADALHDRLEGQVLVEAIVTREGRIRDPKVVRASHPIFIDPAITALKRWRYKPANCDGVPVEMVWYVYVSFSC